MRPDDATPRHAHPGSALGEGASQHGGAPPRHGHETPRHGQTAPGFRPAAARHRQVGVGHRTRWDAHDFAEKLSRATAGRFQLSTDGFNAYPDAVEYNFGTRVDYAQLVKEFAGAGGEEQRQYAPPRLLGAEKISVSGNPEEDPDLHVAR